MGWDHVKGNIRPENTEERKEEWRGEEGRSDERMLMGEKGKGGERIKCPSFIFP